MVIQRINLVSLHCLRSSLSSQFIIVREARRNKALILASRDVCE
jgi:hypothetical protein